MTTTEAISKVNTNVGVGVLSDASQTAIVGPKNKNKGFGLPFWFLVGWLGIVVIWAIFGKNLPFANRQSDYITSSLINEGKWTKTFSSSHPLGTDQNGNDWLSAAVVGARNSVIIAFATIIFGFLVGGGLGMLAGYRKGKIDAIFTFFTTVLLSFPPLLFILIVLTIFAARVKSSAVAEGLQTSVWKLSFTLGILSIPTLYRVVRASTMQFASREFVTAARAMGAKPGRIIMREILPNVIKSMAAYGLVAAGTVMVIEGGLSYLGIGVGESWAWGKMIAAGSSGVTLQRAPHVSFIPIVILFVTVLAFNFIGDKLRERLEVKQAGI
jgi:peptide/nickel transport system permease protein